MKRKYLILLPISLVLILWSLYMSHTDSFYLFKDNWFMSVTMLFGSFIAGATSEGGGAVAFPVMTLFFKIKPAIARDFAIMIQSFGMIMAALAIIIYKIKILSRIITIASLGGIFGIILGLVNISTLFSPNYLKMFFTSFWLSFGVALFLINQREKNFSLNEIAYDKKDDFIVFTLGILGGIITSLTGTGIDILIFSYLTLHKRVCVKVATPTSVILMGINSVIGFTIKYFFMKDISPQSWTYLLVCIPIVIIGAPYGAFFIKDKSKKFVSNFLILAIFVQFISSLIIIDQNLKLIIFSISTSITGLLIFLPMGKRKH